MVVSTRCDSNKAGSDSRNLRSEFWASQNSRDLVIGCCQE